MHLVVAANYVAIEVVLGREAGPFSQPTFCFKFMELPMGVVIKKHSLPIHFM